METKLNNCFKWCFALLMAYIGKHYGLFDEGSSLMLIGLGTAYINSERFAVQFQDRINKLINIDPEDTPFSSMVKKGDAYDDTVRWQTTTLASASSTNSGVQGADVTWAAGDYIAPTGVFNYTQMPQKPFGASLTVDAIRKPGAGVGALSSFNDEKAKKLIELKRDRESALVSNNDRRQPLPESTQSGLLRGVEQWIATNIINANDKFWGGNLLSQAMVHELARRCVVQGGNPDVIMANSVNRVEINGFVARPATRDIDSLGRKIVDVVEAIVTIAGTQAIVFNRYMAEATVLMLEMQYWEERWLRAPQSYVRGTQGSRTDGWCEFEHTLVSFAEKASGKITNTRIARPA